MYRYCLSRQCTPFLLASGILPVADCEIETPAPRMRVGMELRPGRQEIYSNEVLRVPVSLARVNSRMREFLCANRWGAHPHRNIGMFTCRTKLKLCQRIVI
jgi:hypothetical protein